MASATMTFASAQVLAELPGEVTVRFNETNRFLIRGVAEAGRPTNWRLADVRKRVGVAANFYLTPERMPAEGTIFVSTPAVRFDVGEGDMAGLTGPPAWCFTPFIIVCDRPSAICALHLTQHMFVGGEPIAHTSKEVSLISIRDVVQALQVKPMPSTIPFEPLQFELPRGIQLSLYLVATFDMYLEAGSYVFFGYKGAPFSPAVTGRFPEWTITSID